MTKGKERFRKFISDFYLVIILIFLYAPIFTMMVLSFNQSKSRTHWGGFTLSWYTQMFESRAIMYALYTTLLVAMISALVATVIGTVTAIAISHMKPVSKNIFMSISNTPVSCWHLPCHWMISLSPTLQRAPASILCLP